MINKKNIKKYLPDNTTVIESGNTVSFCVEQENIAVVIDTLYHKYQLSLVHMTATETFEGQVRILYVFAIPNTDTYLVPYITPNDDGTFPSLALKVHQLWNYERKVHTFFDLTPIGHPNLKSIVLHENWPEGTPPLRKKFKWDAKEDVAQTPYEFKKIAGGGIYEIPVGPIHAGIIEPGHFRFSMAGESIMNLEPRLGFTHKGTEKLFETLPIETHVRLAEKISGDSSFSHSLAYTQAIETLAHIKPPKRAEHLRLVYAELERLANHIGDIGAIMLDTGYSFGGSHGAILRERILELNNVITGNRFLRGVNNIGGVTIDISDEKANTICETLTTIIHDFESILKIAQQSMTLQNRLEGTGILTKEIAIDYGVRGVAAKASGVTHDVRADCPYSGYHAIPLSEIVTETAGDVHARFIVRIQEVRASYNLILQALQTLPQGLVLSKESITLQKNALAIGSVEGWRGEISTLVATDESGMIIRVAPRDPSFLNWHVVGDVGFENVVPDFPLINKSFNLSYTGYDL